MSTRFSVATLPVAIRSSSSNVKELSRKKSRSVGSKRHVQLDVPDESWEASRLGEFARAEQKRLNLYDKKMAIHAFRLGHALSLAYEKVPYGGWGKFRNKFHVSEATDWRARKLYEEAKSEDALKGLGLMQAYKKYRINKRQEKPKPSSNDQAPPKEPKSLSKSLAQLVLLLDSLIDEAGFAELEKESKEHCLNLIDEAHSILNKISGEISHD